MPLTTAGKNNLMSVASLTHASAFTDLGATEVAGGSYARQGALSWAAAAAGIRAISAQVSIPIPAGTTVVTAGVHDALSAGTSQGFFQIGSTVAGVGTVTASTDVVASFAHGLTTDDRVFFTAPVGSALPAGLSATTLYFVRATGLTVDAFTVSTTSGGASVAITGDGEVAFFKTVPQLFSIAGNLILPATTGLVIDGTGLG